MVVICIATFQFLHVSGDCLQFIHNTCFVTVDPLTIIMNEKKESEYEHETFDLTCTTSESNPSPADVRWERDGTALVSSEEVVDGDCCQAKKTESTTTVYALREYNQHTFVCEIGSKDGREQDTNTLEVLCMLLLFLFSLI